MLGPLWLAELLLLAILWAAVDLVEDGFGSLARGLPAALGENTEELPNRRAVGVQLPLPPAPPTLPAPRSTFLARGLIPRMVDGRNGRGRRGFEETFGGDMVGLTEN